MIRCSQPSKVPGEKLGQRAEHPDERLLGEVLGVLRVARTGGRPAGRPARSGRARPAPRSAPPSPRPRGVRRCRTRPQDRRPDAAETSPDSAGTADAARFRRTERPTDGRHARVPAPSRFAANAQVRTTARRPRPSAAAGRRRRPLPSAGDERRSNRRRRRHRRGRCLRRPVRRRDAGDGGRPGARVPPVRPSAGRARGRRDAGRAGLQRRRPVGRVDRQRRRAGRAVAAARHADRRRPHRPGRRPRAAARRPQGLRRGRHRAPAGPG